ncbi:pyruvate, phosphate dikinase/phosphoenolpyruvate synthase regulator [Rhodobacteraceae bacterium 2CG4]|uniref:Putative pyruvate, phosphate dikinase regulatory protein n=1 Tax=Halovulum marinum TaxID=2662447 RepID=A0A6L5Z3M7_9RHOB|nr:pyruvate, water dikinase regulatory protein [Halovulum marinum]MSU90675.1 pyruvate, phosphate dikinase/phosphoenolpyruvate synthase regulator [Halovulum marinum]
MTKPAERISILLVSDSTGETVSAAVRAAISQFGCVEPHLDLYPFVRSRADLDRIGPEVRARASLLAFTVVDPDLKQAVVELGQAAAIPCVPLLDPLFDGIARVLGVAPSIRPGRQYQVDTEYLDRITAIDYAISHDDGVTEDYLLSADVILVGVSRTSKTPTCIYLAYQGIKAANVPLVPAQDPPQELMTALRAGVPVVGLIASAARLAQVRQTRLRALGQPASRDYSERERIEEELVAARLFFDRYQVPVIDVTRRSIEETAASVRQMIGARR